VAETVSLFPAMVNRKLSKMGIFVLVLRAPEML